MIGLLESPLSHKCRVRIFHGSKYSAMFICVLYVYNNCIVLHSLIRMYSYLTVYGHYSYLTCPVYGHFGYLQILSYRLQPMRLLCPWNSPGKNTGVGCHFLLQGILPAQGSNLGLLHYRHILYHLSQQGSPLQITQEHISL